MKYYIDDDDRAYVENENGIFRLYGDGKQVKTNLLRPDCMKWHECSKEEAIESAKLYESYFKKSS